MFSQKGEADMKRSAFLLSVGVFFLVFGPLAVKAAEDELRVLQTENARLKATLAARDKQIEDLKTELAGLRAENTKVAAQMKALGDQLKILTDNLATPNARPPAEKTASPTAAPTNPSLLPPAQPAPQSQPPLPAVGDVTSLTLLNANTSDYVGRTFVVLGTAVINNYYNYKYSDAKATHVSLALFELRADRTNTRERIHVYLRRDFARPLVDAIAKAVAEGFDGRIIRAKLTILPDRHDDNRGSQDAELLDWQFLDAGLKEWEPWARGQGTLPPKAAAATTPAIKR
jgi:cell division protein FtsB